MDNISTLLFGAVATNCVSVAQRVLDTLAVPAFCENERGDNLLDIAIIKNYPEMVRLLVEKGALINREKAKISPLLAAIDCHNKEMVDLLVELGASVESAWLEGSPMSPVIFAVRTCNYDMLVVLKDKGADVCRAELPDRHTALHEVGDDVPGLSSDTHTQVRLKMAKYLLDNNADLHAKDKNGRTPIHCAIFNCVEVSKFFLKEGAQVRTEYEGHVLEYTMVATKYNDPEVIRLCLERGGDYLLANVKFKTAYHQALLTCSPEVVRVFWEFGCPVNLPEVPGSSKPISCEVLVNRELVKPFQIQLDFFKAIFENDLKKVKAGIKQGAEPKGTSVQIPSPLHFVTTIKHGDPKIARVLLRHGVPVNKLDSGMKKTSLYFALLNENLNVVKEILKFGGCFTKQHFEMLPLLKNNKELLNIVKEVEKAFKLTRKGSNKVLQRLKQFLNTGNKEMVEILMNCVDYRGRSLMNLALQKGHREIAEKVLKLRIHHL